MMAAKAHNVFKFLRQTANFAEAVSSATTSASSPNLPAPDTWPGLTESLHQQVGTPLNPSAPTFRPQGVYPPDVVAAPWAGMPLRTAQGLTLPHLAANSPLGRYLEQLKLSPGDVAFAKAAEPGKPPLGPGPALLAGPLGVDLASLLFGNAAQAHGLGRSLPGLHELLAAAMGGQASAAPPPGSLNASERTKPAATRFPAHAPASHDNDRAFSALLQAPTMQRAPNSAVADAGAALQRSGAVSQQQALQGGRRPRASSSSVHLNKEIMASNSTGELLALVRDKGAQMDFFNISSAISRTPKLAGLQGGDSTVQGLPAQQPHQTLDAESRELADCLAQLMCDKIRLFDARGLANSAWAFGKLRYVPSPALPSLIAEEAINKMDAFCAQNVSNLVWAFVYMHYRDERVLALMAEKVRTKLDEFKPQELANVLWAFASLEFHDPEMVRVATERAARIAPQFKEQELSNAIWAMGRLQYHSPAVFSSLLAEARHKLHHFLPQGIANVAWAMASLGHRDEAMLHMMVGQCRQHLAAFDVQALSNLAWAFASLGFYDPAFMDQLVSEAMTRLDRLSPQNLASILWACAMLGHQDPRMLSAWSKQVLAKLPSFEPQAMANLALSFAKLGCSDASLFDALAAAVVVKSEGCTPQSLSNTAWAFANAAQHNVALMEELGSRLLCALDTCSPHNCSMALWSFATLRHYSPELFDGMLAKMASDVATAEPQSISNVLWACATMGHLPGPFGLLLARQAVSLMPHMAPQELCHTAWALAAMDLMDAPTFQLFTSCLQEVSEGISAQELQQAFQAQMMLHAKMAALGSDDIMMPQLPEPLLSAARQLHLQNIVQAAGPAASAPSHSQMLLEVSAALEAAGVRNAQRCTSPDGLVLVDIDLELAGRRIAIEVLDESRCSSNAPHLQLGDVAAHRRLLEARGWTVVNIGYQEWQALSGLPAAQRGALLLTRMSQHLGLPTSLLPAPAAAPAPARGAGCSRRESVEPGATMVMAGDTWYSGNNSSGEEEGATSDNAGQTDDDDMNAALEALLAMPGWSEGLHSMSGQDGSAASSSPGSHGTTRPSSDGTQVPRSLSQFRPEAQPLLQLPHSSWAQVAGLAEQGNARDGHEPGRPQQRFGASYLERDSGGSVVGSADSGPLSGHWLLPRELFEVMGVEAERSSEEERAGRHA